MPRYYEFEVSLQEVQPRIWRRFLLRTTATFKQRLLGGERAGPPEDCGGTPGYERMVQFIETGEDIEDDDPQHLAEWLDGWRPDAFELDIMKSKFDK